MAGSAFAPSVIIAAEGFRRTISSRNCSASLPPASKRTRAFADSAVRISLKLSRPVLRTTNVSGFVIVFRGEPDFFLQIRRNETGTLASQSRIIGRHLNSRADQWHDELKLIIGNANRNGASFKAEVRIGDGNVASRQVIDQRL